MSAQLVFDLAAPPALGREDFFVSAANELAVRMLTDGGEWPEGKLILVGPPGSGKSHLAGIWAADNGATVLDAKAGPGAGWMPPGGAVSVVVEDAEWVAGRPEAETALFHLHNGVLSRGGRLLLTAGSDPARWGLGLPDLRSRMEAAPRAVVAAPDDSLLSAVIVKLFTDRQLAVPPNLVAYAASRMDRSFAAARDFVDRIDARSLSGGRAVTRSLAAEVLREMERLDSGFPDTP